MTSFSQTARSIIDAVLKHEPLEATWSGVHDYDAEYPDVSADGFAAARARAATHLATLQRWDPDTLSPDDRIDWHMLVSRLEVELRQADELELFKHSPSLYPSVAIEGVYGLLARDFAPLAERLPSLRSRLSKIPAIFASGRANLTRSPAIWREIAIEETQGAVDFLHETVAPIAREHEQLAPALEAAVANCLPPGS